MMLNLDSNLDAVITRLYRGLWKASKAAGSPEVDRIMREGIQNHFNRLSDGGGSDPSALGTGFDNTETVRWSVSDRHLFTIQSHHVRGIAPSQLLIFTGQMRDDFTVNAHVTNGVTSDGSHARLSGGTPDSIEKARRNLGGEYLTEFAVLQREAKVLFPRRQFVYWDSLMRYKLERFLTAGIETEWKK